MDLHAGQVQGFFRIPVDHMVAVPMFAQYVRDLPRAATVERVAVAPDTGPRQARRQVRRDDRRRSRRPQQGAARPQPGARSPASIGERRGQGRRDDATTSSTRPARSAPAPRRCARRARRAVYACATHALFNESALERIAASAFERVIVTDTVPVDPLTQARTTSRSSRSPASSRRRSRTSSRTTRSPRSSPARTSSSRAWQPFSP